MPRRAGVFHAPLSLRARMLRARSSSQPSSAIISVTTAILLAPTVALAQPTHSTQPTQPARNAAEIPRPRPEIETLFSATPYLGLAPLAVDFDATRTQPAANAVYLWNFGDGSSGFGPQTSHTYTAPGTYTATLSVTDQTGGQGESTFTVTVAAAPFDPAAPITPNDARRFLWQAAFGPLPADVDFVVANGYEAWIDAQIAMPYTPMLKEDLDTSVELGYGYGPDSIWDDYCVEAPDQLRQRMAWAMLQVLVMNNPQDSGGDDMDYYSHYIQHGLGNYRDLLGYVTRSHQMGLFLTYIDNRKADPRTGSVPDENYARELMQLFSVGLNLLNPDGSHVLDDDGVPIPTFDNDTVKQFARIFTGYRWGTDFSAPMPMITGNHEFGSKQLLDYTGAIPPGGFIAARTSGAQQTVAAAESDVDAALNNVFYHPNSGPFVSTLLIKRLVTSNPTPAYVQRVTDAFEGHGPYGTGLRGDLAAVAKAILLDDEARNPTYRANPSYGKLMEPLVTRFGLYRVLQRLDRPTETFPFRINSDTYQIQLDMGQSFMGSPSVFNFYLPDYTPPGTAIARADHHAPELQIYNDYTAMATENRFLSELVTPSGAREPARYAAWRLLSSNPTNLVNALNDEIMHGALSTQSRSIIVSAITAITGDTDRVRSATWLVINSPEFRVLR